MRTEVLDRGFDSVQYGSRITQWINDAAALIARRVDYYADQTNNPFNTTSGVDTYLWPADFGRMESLFDVFRRVEMEYVSVRDIDRSGMSNGAPCFYALVANNIRLWPTPDNVYTLEMRYWKMPSILSVDTDTPNLPTDWHHALIVYATWMAFEADDDPVMGQYWMNRWNTELAQFAADAKFPSADGPTQSSSMWDDGKTLGPANQWTLYGAGW